MADAGDHTVCRQYSTTCEQGIYLFFQLTREKDVEKVIALTAQNFGKLDVTINCPTRARTFKILAEKELKKYADHNTAVEKEKSKNLENIFKVCLLRYVCMIKISRKLISSFTKTCKTNASTTSSTGL